MRRQPATIICDAARLRVHHSRRRRQRAIGTTSPAITATTAARPSMAASASSKTAAARARASIFAASNVFGKPPGKSPKQMKKARRDGSRRAPTLVLAGPGLRAPGARPSNRA